MWSLVCRLWVEEREEAKAETEDVDQAIFLDVGDAGDYGWVARVEDNLWVVGEEGEVLACGVLVGS